MKVGIIGPYPPPYGGVSIHVKRLRMALVERGLEVCVFAHPTEAQEQNVIPVRNRSRWYVSQLARRDKRVLHFQTFETEYKHLLPFAALAVAGTPVVVTLQSFRDEAVTRTRAFRLLVPIALRLLPCIICVSHEIRDRLIAGYKINPAKLRVIPGYLPPSRDDEERRSIPAEVARFVLSRYPIITANAFNLAFYNGQDLYGLDLCVELLRDLVAEYPNVGFVFALPEIGDADYYASICQRIADYGLKDHFIFSHAKVEYWPIIEKSSLFIRPTNTDGHSLSLVEALDMGVPSIASNASERPAGTIIFRNRDLGDLIAKTRLVLANADSYRRQLADQVGRLGVYHVEQILEAYHFVLR